MDDRVFEYRRERRKFAVIVYTLSCIFAVLSFIQWLVFLLVEKVIIFNLRYWYFSLPFLIVGVIVITIFVFWQKLRFLMPLNWIFAFIIVECVTVGLSLPIVLSKFTYYLVCNLIVFILVVIFIILGAVSTYDFTVGVVVLFVAAVILFSTCTWFMLLYIVSGLKFALFIFSGCIIILALLFVMYHAQTINGGRYAEMRTNDYILGALILYNDYVLILMISLLIVYGILDMLPRYTMYPMH